MIDAPSRRLPAMCMVASALAILLANAVLVPPAYAQPPAPTEPASVELWRLDCGTMQIEDASYFSDTFEYDDMPATASNGCYLVRHGQDYLLWDAGLGKDYLGNTTSVDGWTSSIDEAISTQLHQIGLVPSQVKYLAISHYHGDHIGQASDFPGATLLIGKADADWIRGATTGRARERLAPWFEGNSPITEISGDKDVFDDGTVVILAMPGHTAGHQSLLVRLEATGPVILTGDLFHFSRELTTRTVSQWNTSRADTLASFDRFDRLGFALRPKVIVQHEPGDIDRLPAFPLSAK